MKEELPQSDIASDSPKSDTEREEMQRRRAEFFKKKGTKKLEFLSLLLIPTRNKPIPVRVKYCI